MKARRACMREKQSGWRVLSSARRLSSANVTGSSQFSAHPAGCGTGITSTWNGTYGLFGELWTSAVDGKNGFAPLYVPWWRHPERDAEWGNTFRERMGVEMFDREFACKFK